MNSHQTPPPWWGWGLFHLRFDSSYVHFPDHLKQNKYCRFRFKSVSRQQPLLIKNTREPFERGRAQTLISSLCPHCESWDFSGYQGTLEKKQYSPQSAPIYLNKNTHIQWQMHPPAQNPTIALAVISLKKKKEQTQKLKHLLQIEVMGWVQFAYVHSWFLWQDIYYKLSCKLEQVHTVYVCMCRFRAVRQTFFCKNTRKSFVL